MVPWLGGSFACPRVMLQERSGLGGHALPTVCYCRHDWYSFFSRPVGMVSGGERPSSLKTFEGCTLQLLASARGSGQVLLVASRASPLLFRKLSSTHAEC
jgi:hypothetical protein